MAQRVKSSKKEAAARVALRRRVMRWYENFNDERWSACLALVDPKLLETGKVEEGLYVESLQRFRAHFGVIRPWHVRVSLHLAGSRPANDPRAFAYIYTVWQDQRHRFHMFQERWVRDDGKWYTRVAGLVVNDREAIAG